MELIYLETTDLSDTWFQALYKILEVGNTYTVERGSFKGQQRLEFDHITIRIKHPGVKPLLPEIPAHLGIPNPVDYDYLDTYLPYLMTTEALPGEDYTYGQYLEPQIQAIIDMYKEGSYKTNQACMTVGEPNNIFLSDPPCLKLIDTRIKDNKLHFFVTFRSNDLWSGFPANLGSIQMLKEYMASMIGVNDGEIIYSCKGLHLYDYTWDLAKTRVSC